MKKIIIIFGLSLLMNSCVTHFQTTNWRNLNKDYSRKTDLTNIEYLGGYGDSIENAIIIKNAENRENGIASEYAYIEKHFGKMSSVMIFYAFIFFNNQAILLPRIFMVSSPSSSLFTSPGCDPIPIFQYTEPGTII